MIPHVLICGISTRAAAESAARAGFRVTSLDGYADLDQHPSVRAVSLPRETGARFTAPRAARAARSLDGEAVVYLSPFENHAAAVAALARSRRLWGNPPDVLARVRDPFVVAAALRARGFVVPELFAAGMDGEAGGLRTGMRVRPAAARPSEVLNAVDAWVVKPVRSGGGRRVRPWAGGRVARGCYLQEWIDGTPASVVFVAAAGRAVPLGVSRQLCGDGAFGADGHRYCGSILAADALGDQGTGLLRAACELASAVAVEFGVVGVNGLDFVARKGLPYPIEINPRWSSSMELVERLFAISVFGAHAAACDRRELPRFDLRGALQGAGAVGKAVVFAREDAVTGDTRAWLEDTTVRDVPHPGVPIEAGEPVCTVFAEAADAAGCYDALVRQARRIYERLSAWRP